MQRQVCQLEIEKAEFLQSRAQELAEQVKKRTFELEEANQQLHQEIKDRKRREDILKDIASGMSVEIGENFLLSLVDYLTKTLKVEYAWVGELIPAEEDSIKTLAVYGQGQMIDNFEYHLAGTPCENVVGQKLCIYPEAIQQSFPEDRILQEMTAESYGGSLFLILLEEL